MALLAEKLILEMLRAKGFYTLRGQKFSTEEINLVSEALIYSPKYSKLEKIEQATEIMQFLTDLAANLQKYFLHEEDPPEPKSRKSNKLPQRKFESPKAALETMFSEYSEIRALSDLDITFIHGDAKKADLDYIKNQGIYCLHINALIGKISDLSNEITSGYFRRHLLKQTFWVCFAEKEGDNIEI